MLKLQKLISNNDLIYMYISFETLFHPLIEGLSLRRLKGVRHILFRC